MTQLAGGVSEKIFIACHTFFNAPGIDLNHLDAALIFFVE
jgi:hypothetical protein